MKKIGRKHSENPENSGKTDAPAGRFPKIAGIFKKILFPPPLPNLFAALIGYGLILCVAIFGLKNPVICYVAYLASAYALTVTITGFPHLIAFVRRLGEQISGHRLAVKFKNTRFGRRYTGDVRFRTHVSLYLGLAVNLLYIAMKMISGFYYRSVWFIALAFYYILLAVMRYLLLTRTGGRRVGRTPMETEWRRYRLCGVLLLLMNQALVGIIVIIVRQNRGFDYPGLLIYAMAAYAFYALISAAVRIVKSRKHGSPILSAAKAVSFAAALVSMLSLTTAMLARFGGGDDGDFRRIMTASVGGGVCAIVIATAVYMIARAQKNLKKGDFNKTQTKSERFGNGGRL